MHSTRSSRATKLVRYMPFVECRRGLGRVIWPPYGTTQRKVVALLYIIQVRRAEVMPSFNRNPIGSKPGAVEWRVRDQRSVHR